jgi:hypothetical protein
VILPQSADYTSGAQVILVDYPPTLEASAVADSSGTALVEFDQIDNGFLWRVERMVTVLSDTNPPAGALFQAYEGPTLLPIRVREGSSSPAFDIADESAPITLQPSSQLVLQWTGLRPGTKASASVQYQLWRRIVAGSY